VAADDSPGPFVGDARRRLESIRRELMREMLARLVRLDQAGGRLVGERDALENARRIRGQILALMRDEGLPVVVGVAEARVADAVDAALGPPPPSRRAPLMGAVSTTFDAEARAGIKASVDGLYDEIADTFEESARSMRKAIDAGLHTGSSLSQVTEEVAQALDTAFSRAAVAVETAIRGAMRKATIDKAEAAGEALGEQFVYYYDGPLDSKSRPFCRRHVGKAYTHAAMQRLDNGTELDVEQFAGGHGCRHRWSPALREDMEREGVRVVA
jgi:hypothetical protein